jgi:hypothetical protein
MRVVTHIEHLVRCDAERGGGGQERLRMRLGAAHRLRIEHTDEMPVETDAAEIGVAVREGGHRVTRTERGQRRPDILEQLHLVARRDEHLEGGVADGRVVAVAPGDAAQRLGAQPGHVVGAGGVLGGEREPRVVDRLGGQMRAEPRVPGCDELRHPRLGAHQHRLHLPEGVVEVEA